MWRAPEWMGRGREALVQVPLSMWEGVTGRPGMARAWSGRGEGHTWDGCGGDKTQEYSNGTGA